MYDTEIGYVQGMNFLSAFLIDHVKEPEDQFYYLIYIMEDLDWRASFNAGMTNIHSMMDDLETEMKLEVTNVHRHLMKQSYNHIVIIFLSTILPIFT